MFKSAVIRDFCRIAKTALFALGVLFVSNSNAFACASGQVDVDGTCYNGKFAVKVDSQNHSKLTFLISASGTFTVNCGTNGTLTSNANDVTNNNYIDRRNSTNYTEYACSWPYYDGTYGATSAHVVTFDGSVDKYNSGAPAIGFYYGNPADYIKAIYGSLGAIFKTLNDGSNDQSKQPSFQNTFQGCTGLTSLPAELFDGVKGAAEGMFSNTFDSCTGLTSLPKDSNGNSTLFKDIVGAAESMFNATFYGCTGLTSLPSGLFNVGNGAAERMFERTFSGCSGLTSLPTDSNGNSTLFNGINGAAEEMFGSTFSGCTGLTSLPTDSNGNSTLFNGINGAAKGMFDSTFSHCTGLTSLPKELFKGVNGGAESMFAFTFNNCTGLTSLPTDLFSDVNSAKANMFRATFNNCTGLTSLPKDSNGNSTLFNGINGAAEGMFYSTFSYCTGLTSLPKELFKDITGANKLFYETFKGCTGLTSLPTDLFSDVNSAKANMFRATFNNCTGLTSLPKDSNGNSTLFNGINGAADVMFKETFSNCTGLTSLPSGLFNIGNDAAEYMFDATFQGCTGLTSLPTDSNGNSTLFNGINGTALFMFNETFSGCSGLTAIPYDLFDGASGTPDDASGMFKSTFYNATNLGAFDFGNGETKDYVPGDFLSGITSDDTTSEGLYFATDMFTGTDLKSPCPAGTTDVTRNIFSDAGKPWCEAYETYTITFNLKGGSGCVNEITYSGTTTLCKPTYDGYTFNGWATTDGGAVVYAANASVTDTDLTLYAKWTPKTYAIMFDATGGEFMVLNQLYSVNDLYAKYNASDLYLTSAGTTATTVPIPSKTEYTFLGWYTAETGGSQVYDANGNLQRNVTGYTSDEDQPKWIMTKSRPLYAQWEVNYCTAEYELDGGTAGGDYNTEFECRESLEVLNPTRPGYYFNGWKITGMESGVTHYYSRDNSAWINFGTSDSITVGNSPWINFGTSDSITVGNSPFYFKNLRSTPGTIKFTAQWKGNSYTLTLDKNGGSGTIQNDADIYYNGSGNGSMTCVAGSTAALPTGFFWRGYTSTNTTNITNGEKIFLGWSVEQNATTGSFEITCPSGNTTYYAVWVTPTCTATNGSSTVVTSDNNRPTCSVMCANGYNTSGTYYGNAGETSYHHTCTVNTITLEYNNGGHGTAPASSSCTYGGTFTMPSAMTETNYTFDKWKVNDKQFDADEEVACTYENLGVYSGTTTITGLWTGDTYKLIFTKTDDMIWDGNNEYQVTYGARLPDISATVPTRPGYTFTGWYDSDGKMYYNNRCGIAFVNYNKTTDTTLYAHWEPRIYMIKFTPGADGSGGGTLYTRYNEAGLYTSYSNPASIPGATKAGYTFTGWYTAETGGSQVYDTSGTLQRNVTGYTSDEDNPKWITTEDRTLYAQWTEARYEIKFNNAYNAILDADTSQLYYAEYNKPDLYTTPDGSTTIRAPTATRTGYTFKGWYTSSGGSQVYDANGNLQRNVTGYTSDEDNPKWITTVQRTLYEQWEPNTYIVTLDVATNGGSGGMGIIKEIYNTKWTDSDGNTITSVTIPTHPTGVFYGYYDSDNKQKISVNGNIKYGSADITSDQTWYAKFGTCACNIGSGSHVASCESITSDDQNRCKYRYTCADYYNTNGEQSGTFYGAENTQTNNAPTCDPNEYIITLDNANATTNGTSILYTKYYDGIYLDAERTQYMDSNNKITIPERSGYITVSYDTNGGSLSSNLTDANTKANYVFDGYYSDVIGGTQYIDTTGIGTSDGRRAGYSYTTNDNVWHAQWKVDKVTTPWVRRDGYTFAGWYDAQNGGNCVARCVIDSEGATTSSRYTPTADITLYAQWTPKTYKVTLNHNGADTSANVSEFWYRYNESDSPCTYYTADASVEANRISENCVSTPITIPTKTGYTFNGYSYYIDASGNISDNLYKTIDDKTLYARWTINTYTINFDLDCRNNGWADRSATYGSSFTVSNPVCSGYTFAGWDITGMDTVEHTYGNSTTNETSISGTTATTFKNLRSTPGTVKFKAKWTSKNYTITYKTSFDGDEISGLSPTEYSTGDTLNLPTNVSLPGYVFSGVWYDGDNEITQITPDMYGDKVLIAKWSSITCPAGYYLQGYSNKCKECVSGDYYCPGVTFTPDGEDHGQSECPTPTNVKEKAYGTGGVFTIPGLAGNNKDLNNEDKYLNDTVEDCVAGLIYGVESIINHDSGIAGSKYDEPKYSYYDRTLPANTNNTVSIQLCAYDPTEEAYTKCFPPIAQVYSDIWPLIYCSQGYYIEQTYVTQGAEQVEQIKACGENDTCMEKESIDWIKENIIGDPYACKKGEPGNYTATYDALVDSTGIDEYVLESGALSVWGHLVDPEKLANWTGGEEEDFTTTDVSDTYKSCSVETDGVYVHSNAASWTKTQCYSTVTFVYNNGDSDTTIPEIYYSESASNGYTLSSLPQPTKTNFEFDGWYDSDDNRVTTSTVLKGDQTLYAHWTQDVYSITLNKNGGSGTIRDNTGTTYTGSGNGTMTCAAGSTAALPTWLEDASSNNTTNISKGFGENAKIFLGWSTNPNATSGVFSASCSADGVTYYAIWGAPDCNAINGNATVSNVTENKPVCEISCDCGYETSGTYTGTAGSTEYTYTCTASTIELNYENGGHGTAPARGSCVYGETFTMPAAMTEPGYTFEKWITSGSTTTEFDAGQTSVECSTATLGNDVCDGSATITGSWTLSTGNCSSTEIEYMGNCYPRVFWMDLNIPDGDKEFEFMISAAGTFYVDCGEGGTLSSQSNDVDTEFKTRIYRPDYVGNRIYTCSYETGGTKTINFAGEALGYNTANKAAISFNHISYASGNLAQDTNIKKITGIYGSLGSIFKSIANPENNTWASEPAFFATFAYGTNIEGEIPSDIFSGITGTAPLMFYLTFYNCSQLTGSLPDFSQISGPGQQYMFNGTFAGCESLDGNIPPRSFLGITSAAPAMFSGTFYGCSKLTGSIPSFENIVFNGTSEENADYMFDQTFSGCSGLNEDIPSDTFAGIKSTANGMFSHTFGNCSQLTGSIPDFSQISGPGKDNMFHGTFVNCKKLTGDIPSFKNITGGTNATNMFRDTFIGCSDLDGKIPRDAFEGITSVAPYMFYGTFSGCSKLKQMPDANGVDHEYIDASFLGAIYNDGTDYTTDNVMTSMFDGTGFKNPCPAGTYEVKPEFGAAANKPWCSPCPENYTSEPNSQNINQCYRACPDTDANGAGTLVSELSGFAYYAGEGVSDDISQCKYQYNITYIDGDKELDDDDIMPKTYVAGVGAEINYIPTKTGYTFTGWFTDNSTFTNQITQIDATLTGDITLYAKWTPDTYIVTYEPGVGGSGSMPNSTATYYETFVPDAPSNDTITKEHATFTGWAVSDTNDTREANTGFRWEYTENKTFTATWVCNPEYILNEDTGACDPKTVALRYIDSLDNSIIETEPQMCTYGENFNLPPAPTKPGFVFAGWEIIE